MYTSDLKQTQQMHKALLMLSFLAVNLVLAQYPRIKKVQVDEVTFAADMDGLPITIHLEVFQKSNFNETQYLVKGWYFYDKYEIKIPVVGYYAGVFGLYLSVF